VVDHKFEERLALEEGCAHVFVGSKCEITVVGLREFASASV